MNSYRTVSLACNNDVIRTCKAAIRSGKTGSICHISRGVASLLTRAYASVPRREEPPPVSESDKIPNLRAIDLARKIRQEKQKGNETGGGSDAAVLNPSVPVSQLQKRVIELRQFTQQLQNVHPNVLAKHLHRGLILPHPELAVVNKPYGVSVQDGSSNKNNISDVLPILAKMVDGIRAGSRLHVCLGLDKETTGTLLLARTEEALDYVQNLHKNHQVERKYWVVAVGVPVPSEGVIDIPVIEREVTGAQPHFKMGLSPVYRVSDGGEGVTKVRANRQAQGAVTQYRVLDSSNGCSLVELQPITGVKHQLRVHMAYALGSPILGDHKYSHWTKLAPQKLPDGVLRRLGLEQSKARYLPLHLHARQLTLPEFKGQSDIKVSCPLPKYFTSTLRRLQIPIPDE
ncbi:pseudouridylate synthase RPUSD4, mitochondrial-like [Oncorhynchus masou masou]|uniref:pseudouridylate synthase RPUSD4, mitochondrial-like n=1 Tax=Oncorhynchus masou masou TaxID=90313 RepID=UPI003184044D